jgi:hypothetical protein
LIVAQLSHTHGVADSTTLVLLALVMALLFAVLAPYHTTGALRRVTNFKFGGVELGLGELKLAERLRPPPRENDGLGMRARPKAKSYPEIVERLKERLSETHSMLELDRKPDSYLEPDAYLAIADKLREMRVLTQDEEAFVLDLIDDDPTTADWSSAAEEGFLDSAWSFAARFRAMVWDRHVRRQLQAKGWFVAQFDQAIGHRPDFLIYRDGQWAVVAARPGSKDETRPENFRRAAERLATCDETIPITVPLGARCLILPSKLRGKLTPVTQPKASGQVRLCDLAEVATAAGWPPALESEIDLAGRSTASPNSGPEGTTSKP